VESRCTYARGPASSAPPRSDQQSTPAACRSESKRHNFGAACGRKHRTTKVYTAAHKSRDIKRCPNALFAGCSASPDVPIAMRGCIETESEPGLRAHSSRSCYGPQGNPGGSADRLSVCATRKSMCSACAPALRFGPVAPP
jgi:hypothetical protein